MDEVLAAQRQFERAREDLQTAVQQAREQGRTWADIGAVLGMTRQAAFKRFGQPRSPGGGVVQSHSCSDVLNLTRRVFTHISTGSHDDVTALLAPGAAQHLTADMLDHAWQNVLADVGELEELRDVRAALPTHEPLDEDERILGACLGLARLECEAGDMHGCVTFDRSLAITGILIRPRLEDLTSGP